MRPVRPHLAACAAALSLALPNPVAAAPVPGHPLRGTVVAADGSPAAGAIVWAAKSGYGPLERVETTADETGRYSLSLRPGSWSVWARKGTQGGEGPARHERVEVAAGRAPDPVTIRLEERGTLRGRLLAAETGRPISGGRLAVDDGLVLAADAQGRFEVGGLRRGNHEAFVVAPGRMRMRVLFDTTAKADTELDVPVPAAGKIVGRVTDPDGKPIPGAYVGRHTSGAFFSINALFVACDPDGRFEYDDAVPPDQPTRLTASAPGFVEDERQGVAAAPGGTPLELSFRLQPKPADKPDTPGPGGQKRRTVSGTVRGPDGAPVEGVVVRWGCMPFVGATQATTDAAGRFRFVVPDEENFLAVLPKKFLPQFPKLPAGGDQQADINLKPGHTARGRVVDDAGKPIADVRVLAVIPSPDPQIGNPFWLSEAAVRTGADGRFVVHGVPDTARFDLLKPGLSDARSRVLQLDGADNAITMQYGGAIVGRVVDRDGKPIRSFRVLVNAPRVRGPKDKVGGFFAGYAGIGVRFTSADGSFVLTGVPADGVFRLTALADGHGEAVEDRARAVPLNHLADAKPTVLKAGPPVRLRVRAVTAAGKPIADARVTLVNGDPRLDRSFTWGYDDASWANMARGRTGADGWADFPALGFGEATVLVRAPGHARQKVGWRGGQKELTAELTPEAALAGVVLDAAGQPVKEFHVHLMNAGGDQVTASAGPDDAGRFRVAELPAGVWSVTVRGPDGRAVLHRGNVELTAGETYKLLVRPKGE